MRIMLITHYYPPEIGAPQARLSEMAAAWRGKGHEITVVTCFPNYPTGVVPPAYHDAFRKKRFLIEMIDGIRVVRCWVYATPNTGFIKRILGHLSFMMSSVLQAGKEARNADVIVVSSPTLFSVISAWYLSRRYAIPYIFEVRDLWPAIFVELGVLKNRTIIGILEKFEIFLYRKAAAIVPVTHSFAVNIEKRGIPGGKIRVIRNGADVKYFRPRARDESLVNAVGCAGKCIVLYLGAHGISHALEWIVEAAHLLRDREAIHFVFIGEGAEKEKVVEHARARNLHNTTFLPGQPKERVPSFYSIADIALVPLRNIPLFDSFIPSKMFEIMAMGRPIVASVRGEARQILKDSGSALLCEPEDYRSIARAIEELASDNEKRSRLGDAGRRFVEREFARDVLADRYMDLMMDVANRS
jgi:hypothetical protein